MSVLEQKHDVPPYANGMRTSRLNRHRVVENPDTTPMFRPPFDPRDRPLIDRPTWRSVLVSYATMAVVPLLLWAVSRPLEGTVTLVGIAVLCVGGRRVHRLRRCFYECQKLTFDVAGKAQITITQISADEAN